MGATPSSRCKPDMAAMFAHKSGCQVPTTAKRAIETIRGAREKDRMCVCATSNDDMRCVEKMFQPGKAYTPSQFPTMIEAEWEATIGVPTKEGGYASEYHSEYWGPIEMSVYRRGRSDTAEARPYKGEDTTRDGSGTDGSAVVGKVDDASPEDDSSSEKAAAPVGNQSSTEGRRRRGGGAERSAPIRVQVEESGRQGGRPLPRQGDVCTLHLSSEDKAMLLQEFLVDRAEAKPSRTLGKTFDIHSSSKMRCSDALSDPGLCDAVMSEAVGALGVSPGDQTDAALTPS